MTRILFVFCLLLSGEGSALIALPGIAKDLQDARVLMRWREEGVDFVEVGFTSQVFRGASWRHVLTIARPVAGHAGKIALITVNGGDDPGPEMLAKLVKHTPAPIVRRLVSQAQRTGGVVASIGQVPFQPIFGGKIEDEAIAFTFTKYFETGDASWPLLTPMTEAVMRAFDVLQEFSKREWKKSITGFVLTGESKRGWTTWLSAARDARIKAVAPQVFDILNIQPQLEHQVTSWGRYSEEIGEYSDNGLPTMLSTPRGKDLVKIIDPFQARQKIKVPKLIILATNDAYWPVDAASLYFHELSDPKYLLYIPNATHEIADTTHIDENLHVLTLAARGEIRLPEVRFHEEQVPQTRGVNIQIKSDVKPTSITLWQAKSETRDFRQAKWSRVRIFTAEKKASVSLTPEAQAFVASYVQLEFDLRGNPFTVTTLVKVLPSISRDK